MHWTYKSDSESDLEQGDILLPNAYLAEVLKKYHPYYISHPDNQLFIVLTQSCDLVRRLDSCKSPYITIAPVRPLRVIVAREFHHQLKNVNQESSAQPYGSMRVKSIFADFLTKLLNNNDPRYFFLKEQQDKNIAEDMCAITALSISIKAEHYLECIKARVLQLDDLFQAKLGWLVGQKYSRVGTPDWDDNELNQRVQQVLMNTAIWIDDDLVPRVNKEIEKINQETPESIIDVEKLSEILKQIKPKKEQAIDAIFKVLVNEGLLPEAKDSKKFRLRKNLLNDPEFSRFF